MTKALLLIFALLTYFVGTQVSFAYYEPSSQRWISRDPLGDIANLPSMAGAAAPSIENERVVQLEGENDSLNITTSQAAWTKVNVNVYGGIANDPINQADPFGLDANSYADCIERYRNPLTEQLPNAIAENLGSGGRVPGLVPPAVHGGNALGNKLAGPVKGGVPSVSGPGHPTTWQHKLLGKWGGKLLGKVAIVLTVAEGFWDIGLLAGCGIAEAID